MFYKKIGQKYVEYVQKSTEFYETIYWQIFITYLKEDIAFLLIENGRKNFFKKIGKNMYNM